MFSCATMTNGATLLRRYLRSKKLWPAQMARDLGVSRSLITTWLRRVGARMPSLEHACRLERLTGGAVPACSWVQKARNRAA